MEEVSDYAIKKYIQVQTIAASNIQVQTITASKTVSIGGIDIFDTSGSRHIVSRDEELYIGTVPVKEVFIRVNNSSKIVASEFGVAITSAGNNARASAALDVVSTSRGALLCPMTSAQKNAISTPAEGLIVYDTTIHKLCVCATASTWQTITSS
jgi:hypothetical protein